MLATATLAKEPLVWANGCAPWQYITAVGADEATKCELDAAALRRARVSVDHRATALANGDVNRAVAGGAYHAADLVGEIGDVSADRVAGRR